jgi:hypothetical protein
LIYMLQIPLNQTYQQRMCLHYSYGQTIYVLPTSSALQHLFKMYVASICHLPIAFLIMFLWFNVALRTCPAKMHHSVCYLFQT